MFCTAPACATAYAPRTPSTVTTARGVRVRFVVAAYASSRRLAEAPLPTVTMPPCVHLGPDAATVYRGPRSTGSRRVSIDAMVLGNRLLRNIAVDVAYAGSSARIHLGLGQRIEPGTMAAGATMTAGTYDPRTNTIGWFPGYIDYGVDHAGQSAVQMLFHEFDHAWYSETTASSRAVSPTMSAVIGAVTYRWTLYRRVRGKDKLNTIGWNGYQHMLIHDDLVANFGSDKTGALYEALEGADDPPAYIGEIARRFADIRPWFPVGSLLQKARPAAPPLRGDASCFAMPRPKHRARENLLPQLPSVDARARDTRDRERMRGGALRAPDSPLGSAQLKRLHRAR